jgi:Rrf2 family protein
MMNLNVEPMRQKMKTTKKTTSYALLATGYIAEHSQEGPVEAIVISEQFNIPMLYLFKVLGQLKKANIVQSKRGPGGGSSLARPAEDITLLEIIETIDGKMFEKVEEFTDDKLFNSKIKEIFQQAREQYQQVTLAEVR